MFITIEGIDGSGKTTQAERLEAHFRQEGKSVLRTREPGDWSQGNALRKILLEGNLQHSLTEVMLFFADRCEHVKQTIEPALLRGDAVICDRYNDSTRAYQCWGRVLLRENIENIIRWCGFPEPDLTFWLDLPVECAVRRRIARSPADRIENENLEFHSRVELGFRELYAEYPDRIVRIDASCSEDQVEEHILAELRWRNIL